MSTSNLTLSVGNAIGLVLEVISDTRNAPKDLEELRNELLTGLLALKGALEVFENRDLPSSQQYVQIVHETEAALETLKTSIEKPDSRRARSAQRLTWHWKKDDVAKFVTRIERIKSWLLVAMTTGNVTHNEEISKQMDTLILTVEQDRDARRSAQREASQASLIQWLAPVDPNFAHTKALSNHQPGTSKWFVEGPLQLLLDPSEERGMIMWLKGRSGSGKTTLLSHIVDHSRNTYPQTSTLFFYCSFDVSTTQEPVVILGSLLAQLSKESDGIMDEVAADFQDAMKKNQRPTLSDLESAFVRYAKRVPNVLIVIDAINETTQPAEIEAMLRRLAPQCPRLRVLISSTNDHTVGSDSEVHLWDVGMNEQDVDGDIRLYTLRKVHILEAFRRFSGKLKQEICDTVIYRSRGVFRYAQCQIHHLSLQRTGRETRRALSDMPQDLNETYERALRHITIPADRRLLKRALAWTCFAVYPLELRGLGDAVILEDDDRSLDDDARLPDPKILVDNSCGLLEYDPETAIVSLSHSSIKTFLTSDWIRHSSVSDFALDDTSCHKNIARKCLTYLSFDVFAGGYGAISSNLLIEHPLCDYAALNWPHHLYDVSADDWARISAFFETRYLQKAGHFGTWIGLIYGLVYIDVISTTQPLYYAASSGYTLLVQAILRFDTDVDLEAQGGRKGSTPLQVACFRRQKEAAQLLIEAGADLFSIDSGSGFSPLWWARANRWEDVIDRAASTASFWVHTKDSVASKILSSIGRPHFAEYKYDTVAIAESGNAVAENHPETKPELCFISSFPDYRLHFETVEEYLNGRFGIGNFTLESKNGNLVILSRESLTEEDEAAIHDLRNRRLYPLSFTRTMV